MEATGKGSAMFRHEAGGHRYQRVPPTERQGRVHTSSITVAVLDATDSQIAAVRDSDIEWKATRGSGAGGQHRNTTDSAIQMRHTPTGISVRVESERSQHQNRRIAKQILAAKIHEMTERKHGDKVANKRREQVGSGMRGDKRRTLQFQNDKATDHVTGKRCRLREYMRGNIELLHP